VAGRRGVGYSEAAGALGRGRGGVASVKRCEHGWERGLSMAAAERLLLTCRRGPTGALIRKHPSHKVTTSEQGVQETVRESGAIYLPRRDRMLGSENFATRAAAHHPRRTGLTEFPCGILSPLGFGPAPPVRCRRLGAADPGSNASPRLLGVSPPRRRNPTPTTRPLIRKPLSSLSRPCSAQRRRGCHEPLGTSDARHGRCSPIRHRRQVAAKDSQILCPFLPGPRPKTLWRLASPCHIMLAESVT
jgi:hypothetical protein